MKRSFALPEGDYSMPAFASAVAALAKPVILRLEAYGALYAQLVADAALYLAAGIGQDQTVLINTFFAESPLTAELHQRASLLKVSVRLRTHSR
jgi:hypothetical protein